MYKIVCEN